MLGFDIHIKPLADIKTHVEAEIPGATFFPICSFLLHSQGPLSWFGHHPFLSYILFITDLKCSNHALKIWIFLRFLGVVCLFLLIHHSWSGREQEEVKMYFLQKLPIFSSCSTLNCLIENQWLVLPQSLSYQEIHWSILKAPPHVPLCCTISLLEAVTT